MKEKLKKLTNLLLKSFGARAVNSDWGPRGFMASFAELKAAGFSPSVVYDVGASDASWSLELKTLYRDSDFVLFEPLPEYEKKLTKVCREQTGFSYQRCGLGAESANLQFNVHDGQSSFLSSEQWRGETIEVPVKRIDDLVADGQCSLPDLIKADIQGFEVEMLKGAVGTLQSCNFIFLEVSWLQIYEQGPYAGEVLGYLAERGFHVYDICSYALRPYDRRLTQSDVLFAHERTGLFAERRWS